LAIGRRSKTSPPALPTVLACCPWIPGGKTGCARPTTYSTTRVGGYRLPRQATALPQEPHPWTTLHPRRSRAPLAGAQAPAQLELRRAGAGGARQSGLSPVHAHRLGNCAAPQNHWQTGTPVGTRGGAATAPGTGGAGPSR